MKTSVLAAFGLTLMLAGGAALAQGASPASPGAGANQACPKDQPNCKPGGAGGAMQVQPGASNQAQQPAAKPDANTAQQPAAKPDANTAQQPPAGGGAGATANTNVTVNITPQQKTEVKQIIVAEKVQPVKVNFTIAIGTVVPNTVVLRACPARFVELFPDVWVKEKRCEYFYLDDGRIVFVEPATLKILLVVSV